MTATPRPAIRRAEPRDAAGLARLRFAFRADLDSATEPEPIFLERCRRWMIPRLAPASPWRCWVLEPPVSNGLPGGSVWLQLLEKLPNPVSEPEWHGYISSLYVHPALRGRGAGSALLEAALAECDRCGCDAAILWPTPRSRSLYLRHGFAVRDDLLERRRARSGVATPPSTD
jgi:GNAT superfamily N-acetyltransferase